MLHQQLTTDDDAGTGTLTIRATPGSLHELLSLAGELGMRPGVTTHGNVIILPPAPVPPPPV